MRAVWSLVRAALGRAGGLVAPAGGPRFVRGAPGDHPRAPGECPRAPPPAMPPWAGRTHAAAVRRALPRTSGAADPRRCRPRAPRSSRLAGLRDAARGRLHGTLVPGSAASRGPFARGVAGNTACLAWVLWGEQPAVGERFTYVTHCTRGVARRTGYHAEEGPSRVSRPIAL
jgi:hypothetical protein